MQGRQNSKISLLGESLQQWIRYLPFYTRHYTKKMKFSIKDSFSTEELLKKSLLKNFFFFVQWDVSTWKPPMIAKIYEPLKIVSTTPFKFQI